MSADGELYISESCRDTFERELNEAFGEGKWELDHTPYCDLWDMNIFPLKTDVLVLDNERGVIGTAIIISKTIVVEDIGGRHIELEPDSIHIRKV